MVIFLQTPIEWLAECPADVSVGCSGCIGSNEGSNNSTPRRTSGSLPSSPWPTTPTQTSQATGEHLDKFIRQRWGWLACVFVCISLNYCLKFNFKLLLLQIKAVNEAKFFHFHSVLSNVRTKFQAPICHLASDIIYFLKFVCLFYIFYFSGYKEQIRKEEICLA